jgi:hypothetical protein
LIQAHKINDWVGQNNSMKPQPGTNAEWGAPGSAHDGGMLALWADGSVHFVPATIDKELRTRLSYMDDGEPTNEF